MAYVRARTARWIVLVTPRVESGPVGLTLPDRVYEVTVTDSGAFFLVDERQLDGLTLRPSKDAHLGVQDLDVQDLDSDASGTSDPDPPTTPTGNLPPPIIRDNGWWHIPDRPAKPDGGPVGVPTDTSVYPSLGVEADSAGLIPVVVRMENGHAVVGGVSLSAQEFAAYVRDQPQWGFRDLMIFASGAGTRSRVDGVRQESSFARRLRDELGVAVTAPRGDLIHKRRHHLGLRRRGRSRRRSVVATAAAHPANGVQTLRPRGPPVHVAAERRGCRAAWTP